MADSKKAELPHPHDLLVRNVLKEPDLAADLFKNYLAEEWVSAVDFDSMEYEPNESVNENLAELLSDLRFSAKFRGSGRELKVFVFFEHQSRPDPLMSFRLLEYVLAAYREYAAARAGRKGILFPYPLAVVLHHGRRPWKRVVPMRELIAVAPGVESDILRFPICLIDLALIPPDGLRGHPMVCALLDSLQSASTGRLPDRIRGIFRRLRAVKSKRRLRAWTIALATYYASIQSRFHDNVDDVADALKELYAAREAKNMGITIAESLRREGRAEGRAEGRTEGKIESILVFIESRFGQVPPGLAKKLQAIRDPKRLEKALKLVGTCQDLKEFEKAL